MADTATTTRKCCRSLGVFCVLTKRLHRPEEQFPDKPIPGNWQVIYHGSNFMSYDPDPSHYVNGSFIVWNLVDIVAKGGLFQIGYGPDRDGEFHPLAVAALHEAGDWLKVNGEAICASAAPSLSCVLPALALRVRVRGRQHPPDAAALERHRVRLRPLQYESDTFSICLLFVSLTLKASR